MIGCITAEGVAGSNKAAHMAAGDQARPGVPSAAGGVGAHADYSRPHDPFPRPGHPVSGLEASGPDPVRAGDFRRPYLAEGHGAESPANEPGLASQAARISELAMTTVGRRP
jgi:hypothetical protein